MCTKKQTSQSPNTYVAGQHDLSFLVIPLTPFSSALPLRPHPSPSDGRRRAGWSLAHSGMTFGSVDNDSPSGIDDIGSAWMALKAGAGTVDKRRTVLPAVR